jgi:hypothetical protein
MKKEEGPYPPLEIRICGDQLITKAHLEEFKEDLLSEIKKLLQSTAIGTSPKWLKTDEVKKMLNVSSGTLQAMRRSGSLPYTKVGGIIYYNMDDIHRMLDGPQRPASQKEAVR